MQSIEKKDKPREEDNYFSSKLEALKEIVSSISIGHLIIIKQKVKFDLTNNKLRLNSS